MYMGLFGGMINPDDAGAGVGKMWPPLPLPPPILPCLCLLHNFELVLFPS